MSSERSEVRSNRRLRWVAIPVAVSIVIVLAGCTQEQLRGYLPGEPGITNHTDRVVGLWSSAWMVLLIIGLIVWGMIIWTAVVAWIAYIIANMVVGLRVSEEEEREGLDVRSHGETAYHT